MRASNSGQPSDSSITSPIMFLGLGMHTEGLAAQNEIKMPWHIDTVLKCLICIASYQCLVSRIVMSLRYILKHTKTIFSNSKPDPAN